MQKSEVDGHAQANDGEENGQISDTTGVISWEFAAIELGDQFSVAKGGVGVHDDTQKDKCNAKPERELMRGCSGGVLHGLEFLKEQAKTGNDETKTHEGETSANPGEEGSLGGEVHSGVLFCGLVHGGIVRQ